MRILTISSLFALSLAPAPAAAAEGLSRLDVAGVRLGMTADQAGKALAKNFGVPASQVKKELIKRRDGTSYETIVFDDGKTKCQAVLREDPSTHEPVVKSVGYAIPDTPDNREAMKAAAVKKYGSPSSTPGRNGYDVKWCADPANAGPRPLPDGAQICKGEEMVSLLLNSEKILFSLGDVNRHRRAQAVRDDAVRRSNAATPKL